MYTDLIHYLNQFSQQEVRDLRERCENLLVNYPLGEAKARIVSMVSDYFKLPVIGIGKHRICLSYNGNIGFKMVYNTKIQYIYSESYIYQTINDELVNYLVPTNEYSGYITLTRIGKPIKPATRQEKAYYINLINNMLIDIEAFGYNTRDMAVDDLNQIVELDGSVCFCDYLELYDEMTE